MPQAPTNGPEEDLLLTLLEELEASLLLEDDTLPLLVLTLGAGAGGGVEAGAGAATGAGAGA